MEFGSALGGLVSGGLSLIGGQLNAAQQRQAQRHADDFQREMANTGIQRRVADAKAAGLHPLFALGANVPAGQPVMLGSDAGGGSGLAEMGQDLKGAIARMTAPDQRTKEMQENEIASSIVYKNNQEGDLFRAQAEKISASSPAGIGAPLGVRPEGGVGPEGQFPSVPGATRGTGYIDKQAAPEISQKHDRSGRPIPGVQAGTDMSYQEIELPNGMPMMVPRMQGSSLEEMFSEMSIAAFNGLVEHNQNVYGGNWKKEYLGWRYLGSKPEGKYSKRREQPTVEEKIQERSYPPKPSIHLTPRQRG